jgi:hypothetical protein
VPVDTRRPLLQVSRTNDLAVVSRQVSRAYWLIDWPAPALCSGLDTLVSSVAHTKEKLQ